MTVDGNRPRGRGSIRRWAAGVTAVAVALVAAQLAAPRAAYAGAVPHHCTDAVQILNYDNGELVAAELNFPDRYYGMLRARTVASDAGPWERFQLCKLKQFTNTQFAIRSLANGKWVSAEIFYGNPDNAVLRARADTIGPWEVFTSDEFDSYTDFPRNTIFHFASSYNGDYVAAELAYGGARYGELRARTLYGHEGLWEEFMLLG